MHRAYSASMSIHLHRLSRCELLPFAIESSYLNNSGSNLFVTGEKKLAQKDRSAFLRLPVIFLGCGSDALKRLQRLSVAKLHEDWGEASRLDSAKGKVLPRPQQVRVC